MLKSFTITSLFLVWTSVAHALPWGEPIGRPGVSHNWAPAFKQAIGTAFEENSAASPVWFTVSEGVLSEVFYPHPDQAQVGELEFIVTDGHSFLSEQKRDTLSLNRDMPPEVTLADDGMSVHISGMDRLGLYSFEQTLVTDPDSPSVRIHTKFKWNQLGLKLYFVFKPTVKNTAYNNFGYTTNDGLFATDLSPNPIFVHLASSIPWQTTSAGYVGFSDGWQDLSKNFVLTQNWRQVGPGHIAITGQIPIGDENYSTVDLALSFGKSEIEALTYAQISLRKPFDQIQNLYETGWISYLERLRAKIKDFNFLKSSSFARRSAQIIKMHEDKLNPGAIVSSLSKPGNPNTSRAIDETFGYHRISPRDLYYSALALLAAGDVQTPISVLKYLIKTQRKDGSWPQSFWVDGTPLTSEKPSMDLVAYPILLAGQLQKRGIYQLNHEELEMVRKAAAFILSHGPATPQDQWQEEGGLIPKILALEVAALRVTRDLTHDSSVDLLATDWNVAIEKWTLNQNLYYLPQRQNSSVDGGFLELVRMGLREADDPRIQATLNLYEDPKSNLVNESIDNRHGKIYRRIPATPLDKNRSDGFWPVLAAERGQYSVARKDFESAEKQLLLLEQSATVQGLIPERLISPPFSSLHVGLGVACPTVWAHSEDILLHRSIEEGMIFDTPQHP
jgi:glucoamylase